jgi:hypothetical protein
VSITVEFQDLQVERGVADRGLPALAHQPLVPLRRWPLAAAPSSRLDRGRRPSRTLPGSRAGVGPAARRGNSMTNSAVTYRTARNALLAEEMKLRRQMERVA